ncbi:MAG: Hsp20/alpha crystallin family protein [Thermodesulfobacteriota bacterium]
MAKASKKVRSVSSAPDQTETVQSLISDMEEILHSDGSKPIGNMPRADIFSTSDDFVVVEVELPGVRSEDIEVTLFKNALSIKALKYECFEDNRVNYVCMERSFGRLFRTIEIPQVVNPAKAKAVYKGGVLTIRMPRVEEKRGRLQHIPVEQS